MIVCKFILYNVDITVQTLSTNIFDQVTDNPGTSVQPIWLADVSILMHGFRSTLPRRKTPPLCKGPLYMP